MSPDRGVQDAQFQQLYDRYFRSVVHFFQLRGFPREECLDLAQDTFRRVYKGMEAFEGRSRIETWLFKIATRIGINALRNSKTAKRAGLEVSIEEMLELGLPLFGEQRHSSTATPTQLEDILSAERLRMLQEALADLPPRMRQCLVLRVYQGLKYREIATLTQVAPDTVKAHIYQARKQLQQRLGAHRLTVPDEGGHVDD